MVTHSSILAWEILWTEELGSLQSHKKVRHDLVQMVLGEFTVSSLGHLFLVILKVRWSFIYLYFWNTYSILGSI